MDCITLRPHHFLCIRFWQGKGYSESFTEKMESIIPLLKADFPIKITTKTDDLCSCCPHRIDLPGKSFCKSQKKVLRYDRAVLENCNLTDGQMTTWNEMYPIVSKVFFNSDLEGDNLFKKTCKDCSWFEICNNFGRQN